MNKREMQYQKTLEAIRNSVDEIVRSEGFDKLTIRGICRKAGINHGTFYHYFSSKDDLLMDRQNRFVSYFTELYESRLKDMDPRDALKEYTREYMSYIETRLVSMLVSLEKTLLSLSAKGKLEDTDAQIILMKIIQKGVDNRDFTEGHTAESIYNFLQMFFLGFRLRYCHTAGEPLPGKVAEDEIYKWIDSLYPSCK